MRVPLRIGVLVGSLAGHAQAQTAEEAVAMMLYGQTKTEFFDREVVETVNRAGEIIGHRAVARITIRKLDGCRFEISARPVEMDKGEDRFLTPVFDFSKVSVYEAQVIESPADATAPSFQASLRGSDFFTLIGAEWRPTFSWWSHQIIQQPDVDLSRLQNAHDFFRATFCPARAI